MALRIENSEVAAVVVVMFIYTRADLGRKYKHKGKNEERKDSTINKNNLIYV